MSSKTSSGDSVVVSEEESSSIDEDFHINYKKLKRLKAKENLKKATSKLEVKTYACDECQAVFEYSHLLSKHKLKHAKIKLRISCFAPGCSYNSYCFSSKQSYQRHMMKKHGIKTKQGRIEYLYQMESGNYHILHVHNFDLNDLQRNDEKHALEIAYGNLIETFPENENLETSRINVKQEIRKRSLNQQSFTIRPYANSIQKGNFINIILF